MRLMLGPPLLREGETSRRLDVVGDSSHGSGFLSTDSNGQQLCPRRESRPINFLEGSWGREQRQLPTISRYPQAKSYICENEGMLRHRPLASRDCERGKECPRTSTDTLGRCYMAGRQLTTCDYEARPEVGRDQSWLKGVGSNKRYDPGTERHATNPERLSERGGRDVEGGD